MKQRLADNISLVAQSPRLDRDGVEVVVTVPTFRRPEHLLATLRSIKAQETERTLSIIVMENEAVDREGAKAATPLFEDGTFSGQIVIAHDRGNCHAYNAGWFAALTQFPNFKYLCVIDDDELADPDWIERHCQAAEEYGADLVGGPQVPVFAGEPNARCKDRMRFPP
ncbi:MAG: glycosyltransferase, partial [Pseudomonadota bacterium]